MHLRLTRKLVAAATVLLAAVAGFGLWTAAHASTSYTVTETGAWTMINARFPNQSYWTFDRASHARVGYYNDGTTSQLFRSIFQFDTAPWRGATIQNATLSGNLIHSWSCQPMPTEVHLTGAIGPSTTWNNNAGTWGPTLATVNNASCNDVPVFTQWNVTNGVQQAASTGSPTIALGLRATYENLNANWRKYDENTIRLTVTYTVG